MSKKQYKKALSGVRPSEQTVERIMDMTNLKRRGFKRGLIIALVAVLIIACCGITANAATDGAVSNAIDSGIAHIRVIIDGKELNDSEYQAKEKTYVDNGKIIKEYDICLPDNGRAKYEIVYDDDSVEWACESDADVNIKTEDFNEPTTAEAE